MENQVAPKPMILVIEPDPVFLTGISAVLDQEGYRCFLSRDLTVANKALEKIVFDLIILSAPPDPWLPNNKPSIFEHNRTLKIFPSFSSLPAGKNRGGNFSNRLEAFHASRHRLILTR